MPTVAIKGTGGARGDRGDGVRPFFSDDAPEVELGGDIAHGAAGLPCYVSGQVRDTDGHPIAGARIDVWEADEDGFYDVQYSDDRSVGRGRLRAGADGGYWFWSVLPAPYPIPHDGPAGDLLRMQNHHLRRLDLACAQIHRLALENDQLRDAAHAMTRVATLEHR
ncbi:dioxygenase family protein [Amycolatopsis sp. NPDC005003]